MSSSKLSQGRRGTVGTPFPNVKASQALPAAHLNLCWNSKAAQPARAAPCPMSPIRLCVGHTEAIIFPLVLDDIAVSSPQSHSMRTGRPLLPVAPLAAPGPLYVTHVPWHTPGQPGEGQGPVWGPTPMLSVPSLASP